MGISYKFWFTNKHVDTFKIVFCLTAWEPPKVTFLFFFERTSWKQWSPDRGVEAWTWSWTWSWTWCPQRNKRQNAALQEPRPHVQTRAECPTLTIRNLRLCYFSKFVSKEKSKISKMRQNVARDEEIKVNLFVAWFWSRHGGKQWRFQIVN